MDSAAIMLLPDKTYIDARPEVVDHHLTVAFFGRASEISPEGYKRLRSVVNTIADRFEPISAKANGVGVLDAGGDGFALVDLIDGIGPLYVRSLVQGFDDGIIPKINTRHGFTPHMTRAYFPRSADELTVAPMGMIDNLEFTFTAVGLWFGDLRYEISL
jgi:2'-5' RNA ligase